MFLIHPNKSFRIFLLLFLGFGLLPLLWALSNPLWAAPDEGLHFIRAEAVIRLRDANDLKSRIPAGLGQCFAGQPSVPASCQLAELYQEEATAYVGMRGYPPLFHFFTGIPSLFGLSINTLYFMRIAAILISTMFIALSLWLAVREWAQYWVLVLGLIAITPQAIFFTSTMNPSGFATSVSLATWVSGFIVLCRPTSIVHRHASWIFALSLAVQPFIRRDSVVWTVLILLVLLLTLGLGNFNNFLRDRRIQRIFGAAFFAVLVSRIFWTKGYDNNFITTEAAPEVRHSRGVWVGLDNLWLYLREMIGTFGWLDAPLTDEMFWVGILLTGIVLILALSSSRGYQFAGLFFGVFLLLAFPVAVSARRWPYYQGRYSLPFVVGLIFVAGLLAVSNIKDKQLIKGLSLSLFALAVVFHFFAFAQNLRRYSVGNSGPWSFPFKGSSWNPPLFSNLTALVLYFLVLCFLIPVAVYSVRTSKLLQKQT